MPRQLEEVDGPLCPAPGYVLFFRTSSTSQSDTPPHSAHFSPPLCQCTTDVDEQRAEVVCVVSPMTHEREKIGTRFANSRLIEKLVRHKNREIIAAGKMREKSLDSLSVYASWHVSTIYNGFQSGTADIINKTPQCAARSAV
ncbi:hypothetical protein ALC56_01306 [Trachymyrmex septentrionalis]|uniref:Uncharacterized protein n=1 Tax=Trachymyrmex septentrionalis TaxID=34720 RepID=A0A151K0S3_9HYME|nr:hypothetical protein ALC56_01306 [Trachymyrmex septentrionalis]